MLAERVGLRAAGRRRPRPCVRALGRQGVSRGARGRSDPARGTHRRGGEGRRPRIRCWGTTHASGCASDAAGRTTLPSSMPSSGSERDALSELDGADEWENALAREPEPVTTVEPDRLDAVLSAFADFADLKSPWIRGHSRSVASLAEEAGRLAGLGEPRVRRSATGGARSRPRPGRRRERDLGQAGLAHDLGVGAGAAPPLLHRADPRPVSVRSRPWSRRRRSHHERVDGSGYHRALPAEALSHGDRILAAADVLAALTADRPHRPALGRTTKPPARSKPRRESGSTRTRSPACSRPPAGGRPRPRPAGRPT